MGLLDRTQDTISDENWWNYSDQQKEGFSQTLQGTIIKMEEVQASNFQTKQPDFWPDGNPKIDLKLTIQDLNGVQWSWQLHGGYSNTAYQELVKMSGDKPVSMLLGHNIGVQTFFPKPGDKRLWKVTYLGQGNVPVIGAFEFKPQAAMPPVQGPVTTTNNMQQPPHEIAKQQMQQAQSQAQQVVQQAQQEAQSAFQAAANPFLTPSYPPSAPVNNSVNPNTGELYDEDVPF